VALLLAIVGEVHAHRLVAEYHVLPGHKVQIEAWFDQGGTPRNAKVQVSNPDEQILAEGTLDANGIFVFSYTVAEPLKVVIAAGEGHRKELYILQADLAKGLPAQTPHNGTRTSSATPNVALPSPAPLPLSDRSTRISVKDVLLGIGFLLALAAFILSVRSARQLRRLRHE
jgi:nickel transport protein